MKCTPKQNSSSARMHTQVGQKPVGQRLTSFEFYITYAHNINKIYTKNIINDVF
jgi:hypothetical protein